MEYRSLYELDDFNGGQRANNVRLQRAQLDETINQFNTTVLTAVQEVDNAMSSYKNSIKQIVACREMLNQGKEAFKLSLDLYKQGLSPFQMYWMHSVRYCHTRIHWCRHRDIHCFV